MNSQKMLVKSTLATLVLASVPVVNSLPAHSATMFTSVLNSAQEVSPAGVTNSPVTGSAELELNGSFLEFVVNIAPGFDFSAFEAGTPADQIPPDSNDNLVTLFHIHNGARGVNGPVVFGIYNPDHDFDNDVSIVVNQDGSATITGSWGPTDGAPGDGNPTTGDLDNFIPSLLAANPGEDVDLYFNLHTVGDPAGAIRGQLQAVPEPLTILGTGFALASMGAMKKLRRQKIIN